jgi:hypothetical protein
VNYASPAGYRINGLDACPSCARQCRGDGRILRPAPQPGQRATAARLDEHGIPLDAMDGFGNPVHPIGVCARCEFCGATSDSAD